MTMLISKSDYMLFLKHPAWIWLKKYDKSKLPPISESLQAIFDEGHLFEKYAEQLFPDATRLGFDESDFSTYITLPKRTKDAIDKGAKTILQGRFEYDNLTCIVDVLEKVGENEFDLYEIKSSTEIKEEHLFDLAFQVYILEGLGIPIRKISVIHVNNEYKRKGEIDIKKLCFVSDVTEKVREKKDETEVNIQAAFRILNSKERPDLSPRHTRGEMKDWMEVYRFIHGDFDKYSIYDLCRLRPELVADLEDLNIKLISDIPDGIKLGNHQKRQLDVTKLEKQVIDKDRIRNFLSEITYPLYFLDYETMSGVIPQFDGTKPYQQLPFQYSLYVIDAPGEEAKHKEYLHRENSHPVLPLLKKLREDIKEGGTIFVWHESFEKGRNTEMGELFPEYKEFMESVNDRIIDLKTPFSSGWFLDKDFLGSASIKKVLPVLFPELSYKDLIIQEGTAAQRKWMKHVLNEEDPEQREEILNALVEYCRLDTLAMVKIFEKLQKELTDDTPF